MAINDFTKGGQTFFQGMRMFFDIFWKLVIVFFVIWAVSFSGLIYIKTTPYQRYKAYTLIKVAPFSFLFNGIGGQLNKLGLITKNNSEDASKINFKNASGYTEKLTFDVALHRIATPQFMSLSQSILFWSAIEGLLISLLFTVIIAKLLIRYGRSISEQKILRGTTVCKPHELARIVYKRNRGKDSALTLGGVPLPHNAETQHIWVNGTSGAGKTVAISELMAQVRNNNRRGIVYDYMGIFVARFYRPGKDIILNPFDERSAAWNLWAECESSVDYEMIAASQIPIIPGIANQDPFWTKAARSLYAATARRLQKEGRANNITLLRYLLTSDLDKLRELLKNTEAESLVSKDLEKTALSVKAILNDYIKGMRFLRDDGPLFSIRDWVRRDDDDSWLFITSRSDYHETLIPLISTWYDVAITTALSLPNNPDRRIYNFLDELPTLQYLPSLQKGMSQGRQKGLCFVLGTQDLSQLRVNYGADNAKSLIANANNKFILRTVDDAENIAHLFNQSEVQENNESVSYGVTDSRDGVSISTQRHMQSLVLPSELQMLDDLEGYLRLPGRYPVTKLKLDYVNYDEPNERLVPSNTDVDCLIEQEVDTDFSSDDEIAGNIEEKNLYQQDKNKLSKHIVKDKTKQPNTENANTPLNKLFGDKAVEDEDNYRL